MPAGRLRQLWTIESPLPGNELEGTPTDRWEEVRDVLGSLEPLTGREYVQGQQVQSNVTHTFRCRHFSGAHTGMRLKRSNRVLNVESVVNENEANRFLVWRVVEVV